MHRCFSVAAQLSHHRISLVVSPSTSVRRRSLFLRPLTPFSCGHCPVFCRRAFTSTSCTRSVYNLLEARLLVSPLMPNDALQLLVAAPYAPVVHHDGVLRHLVDVIRGNACCLDPQLCQKLMLILAFPTLPRGLQGNCESKMHDLQNGDPPVGQQVPSSDLPSPLDDPSVRVALAPLHESLVLCALIDLRARLDGHSVGGNAIASPPSPLWAQPLCTNSGASREIIMRSADMQSETEVLVEGVAAVLAFSAQPEVSVTFHRGQKSAAASSQSTWLRRACTNLACKAIQRLAGEHQTTSTTTECTGERAKTNSFSASMVGQPLFLQRPPSRSHVASPPSINLEEEQWELVCRAAQYCWYWSIITCQATPMLPTRALRSCVVRGVIGAYTALNQLLGPEHSEAVQCADSSGISPSHWQDWSQQKRFLCADTLAWLLTRSLPVVNDMPARESSDRVAVRESRGWAPDLRNAFLLLANTFSHLVNDLVRETHHKSSLMPSVMPRRGDLRSLVEQVAAVTFRLTLQCGASAPQPAPGAALSEALVGRKLLQSVFSVQLYIQAPRPFIQNNKQVRCTVEGNCSEKAGLTHLTQTLSRTGPGIAITEETWCRLTCAQHLILSLLGTSPEESAAVHEHLLRIGVRWLRHASANDTKGTEQTDKRSVEVDDAALFTTSADCAAKPLFSIEFVFLLVKCWQAWLGACAGVLREDGGAVLATRGESDLEEIASCVAAAYHIDAEGKNPAVVVLPPDTLPCGHELSLWIAEAWAAALDVAHDRNPLSVCALWSALSTPRAQHSACHYHQILPRLRAVLDSAASCEERLANQCGHYLIDLRNSLLQHRERVVFQMGEARPRLSYHRETAGLDGSDTHAIRRWRPAFAPPFLSHVGLRLLRATYRDCEDDVNGCVALPDESHTGTGWQLPLSETTVEVLRRTIDSPLSAELMFYQLSMTAAYVSWCEAAGVHIGWCYLSTEDCDEEDSDAASTTVRLPSQPPHQQRQQRGKTPPWWILTVEGTASTCGLRASSDTAALAYFWCLGDSVTCAADLATRRRCSTADNSNDALWWPVRPYNRSLCAVSPLCPSKCSTPQTHEAWLRQSVDHWTRRYALRLLLFLLREESWQRYRQLQRPTHKRKASSATQSRQRNPGKCAEMSAAQTCSSVVSGEEHELLSAEALESHLCDAAHRLLRRVNQLTLMMQRSRRLSHATTPCSPQEARREVTQLLCSLRGVPSAEIQAHPSACLACLLDPLCTTTSSSSSVSLAPSALVHQRSATTNTTYSAGNLFQLRSTEVRELEERLYSLGLVGPDPSVTSCRELYERCGHNDQKEEEQCLDVSLVEEAHELLSTLCAAPSFTFIFSPCVLTFTYSLWDVCWQWLLQLRPQAQNARGALQAENAQKNREGGADFPWCVDDAFSEPAEVDALVSCRAGLHTTRQLHVLAAELIDYTCEVYAGNLRRATEGSFCLVTSPTEALEHQAAARACLRVADDVSPYPALREARAGDPGSCRGSFAFSAAAVRAYEVLCLGRFGAEEQRRPVVWQRWLQELGQEDAVMRQHRLVHWQSRLTSKNSS